MPASITFPVTDTPVEMTAPVTEIAAPAVADTTAQACRQPHIKQIANHFKLTPPRLSPAVYHLA